MTRSALARGSGVSERYLAQLEAGKGNISVCLLRDIARTLRVSLAELLREGGAVEPRPAELHSLLDMVEQLPPQAWPRARQLLEVELGSARYPPRTGRIALIGLRGAGKSTLGALLARQLGIPFVELDREVEAVAGMSLGEIFALYGGDEFRRFERKALEQVLRRLPKLVLATGGGIVLERDTYDHLLNHMFGVWVRAEPAEHMQRVIEQGDMRPMQGRDEAMEELRRMLRHREALYRRADRIIDTSGASVDRSLSELLAAIAPVV